MKNIFIGLLLIFFNLNLDINTSRINLIPDFIGYLFIIKGIAEMSPLSNYFMKIINPAKILMGFSIIFYAADILGFSLSEGNQGAVLAVSFIFTLANLYISWNIVKGILDMEKTSEIKLEGNNLFTSWKPMAIFSVLVYLLVVLQPLALISIILAFIFQIYFLFSFSKSKNIYREINP